MSKSVPRHFRPHKFKTQISQFFDLADYAVLRTGLLALLIIGLYTVISGNLKAPENTPPPVSTHLKSEPQTAERRAMLRNL